MDEVYKATGAMKWQDSGASTNFHENSPFEFIVKPHEATSYPAAFFLEELQISLLSTRSLHLFPSIPTTASSTKNVQSVHKVILLSEFLSSHHSTTTERLIAASCARACWWWWKGAEKELWVLIKLQQLLFFTFQVRFLGCWAVTLCTYSQSPIILISSAPFLSSYSS